MHDEAAVCRVKLSMECCMSLASEPTWSCSSKGSAAEDREHVYRHFCTLDHSYSFVLQSNAFMVFWQQVQIIPLAQQQRARTATAAEQDRASGTTFRDDGSARGPCSDDSRKMLQPALVLR